MCRVASSKSKDFIEGDYVVGNLGWTTCSVVDVSKVQLVKMDPSIPANMRSAGLGVLGMPGYVEMTLIMCYDDMMLYHTTQCQCLLWFPGAM